MVPLRFFHIDETMQSGDISTGYSAINYGGVIDEKIGVSIRGGGIDNVCIQIYNVW